MRKCVVMEAKRLVERVQATSTTRVAQLCSSTIDLDGE